MLGRLVEEDEGWLFGWFWTKDLDILLFITNYQSITVYIIIVYLFSIIYLYQV